MLFIFMQSCTETMLMKPDTEEGGLHRYECNILEVTETLEYFSYTVPRDLSILHYCFLDNVIVTFIILVLIVWFMED